jgi:hypothetical protein
MLIRVGLNGTSGNPFEGVVEENMLRSVSFLELLGMEYCASTTPGLRLNRMKEAFVLLAQALNDRAAKEALKVIFRLAVPTRALSPQALKVSAEECARRVRAEEQAYFHWLHSVYWSLPLYVPVSCERENEADVTNATFEEKLKETKQLVLAQVSSLWTTEFDELAFGAFNFLVDHTDRYRFLSRAKPFVAALEDHRKKHGFLFWEARDCFNLPEGDAKVVFHHMRSSMTEDLTKITKWIEKVRGAPGMEKFEELFGHAFVRAGGKIPLPE